MFLGRGNNHQPVHNELCTDHLILAERLPHGIFSSDGDHNDSVCDTSGLESQQNGRTAGRAARGDWNTRCSEDQRRTTALAWIFLLLCIGIYTDPLVKQLSGRCKRYLCGACGGICGIVLQRYHARKIFGRICDGKIR